MGTPQSPGRPAPSRAITLPRKRGRRITFPRGFDSQATGRGALPAESAPDPGHNQGRQGARESERLPEGSAPPPREPAEFRGSTLWSHPFASMRFHVLLNSLFKVLFNFPSRYLSAIGLVSVFSLRWSLPPALGCIPKQPDSGDESTRDGRPASQRPNTRSGQGPNQENSDASEPPQVPSQTPQVPPAVGGRGIRCWAPPCSLAVTEGILVSFFSSAY